MVTRSYGCVPGLPDQRSLLAAAVPGVLVVPAALPSMVDLRSKLGPTYDQDGIGSCSSNAAAGLFDFNDLKQGLAPFSPSRLATYYWARAMRGWQDSDSGSVIADNISVLAGNPGAAPEADWPYDPARFREAPPQRAVNDARGHQATIYLSVDGSLDQMRGCLAAGFPFEFGATLYSNFEDANTWRTGDVPEPSGIVVGGHALLATGYDDSTQRFRIRNSWGSGWGVGGNGTISYSYLTGGLVFDRWTIRQVTGLPMPPDPGDIPQILAVKYKNNSKLIVLGLWQSGSALRIDGNVPNAAVSPGQFVVKNAGLNAGEHIITVLGPTGISSLPFLKTVNG